MNTSELFRSVTSRASLKPRATSYRMKMEEKGYALLLRRNAKGPDSWGIALPGNKQDKLGNAENAAGVGLTFKEAMAKAKEHIRVAAPAIGATEAQTVKMALQDYRLSLGDRNPDVADYLLSHLPTFHDKLVALVTAREWESYRDELSAGVKHCTGERRWKIVKAAMNRAADYDNRIQVREWRKVKKLQDDTDSRNCVLEPAHIAALLKVANEMNPELGLFLETLKVTGARPVQVMRMGETCIHPGKVMMPKSKKGKNKQPGFIPLNVGDLADRLRGHLPFNIPGVRLEDSGVEGLGVLFERCRKLAGVPETIGGVTVTPYAFRHTAITRLLLRGVPAVKVAKLMDTSVGQIEKTYAAYIHLQDEVDLAA